MQPIIQEIRQELTANAQEAVRLSGQRFFKHAVQLYGVKSSVVGKIAKNAYQKIKIKSKQDIFALCEILWQSEKIEESFIACHFAYSQHKNFTEDDFAIFETWIKNYISNWASCDTFCNHTVGIFLAKYPNYVIKLKTWAKSDNPWLRRAAAVSLIIPVKAGQFLSDVFEIADILLLDKEDLVQKGYGWLLKVAANKHETEVFNYVMSKKAVMPRTALRYAIEKMPKDLKTKAMIK